MVGSRDKVVQLRWGEPGYFKGWHVSSSPSHWESERSLVVFKIDSRSHRSRRFYLYKKGEGVLLNYEYQLD